MSSVPFHIWHSFPYEKAPMIINQNDKHKILIFNSIAIRHEKYVCQISITVTASFSTQKGMNRECDLVWTKREGWRGRPEWTYMAIHIITIRSAIMSTDFDHLVLQEPSPILLVLHKTSMFVRLVDWLRTSFHGNRKLIFCGGCS